jgi:hypothetical protein
MKTKLFLLLIIAISFSTFAQMGQHRRRNGMSKIEELEKVKLIEALNMDEQTTLKFFARRSEHMNKMKKLVRKSDNLLDKISEENKKNSDNNSAELKKMIADYLACSGDMIKEKEHFINSLSDILSYEQISKLLVFEKRFREELKGILFRQRMKGRN